MGEGGATGGAVGIETDLFVQGLGDALRHSSMLLAGDHDGVDHPPAVIDGDKAQQIHLPGLDVDLHHGGVGS